MKKILTTTVMTAILATTGFALQANDGEGATKDAVGMLVYDVANFTSGTDSVCSTIKPSGTVNIGCDSVVPVIASDWTLEPGSTMNVDGIGFKLTKTLNINPNAAGAIPVQCNLDNSEDLYYEYSDKTNDSIKYYKLVGTDGSATGGYLVFDSDAKAFSAPAEQPGDGSLNQTKTSGITGMPILEEGAERATIVIDMGCKSGPKTTTLNNIQVVTPTTTALSEAGGVVECSYGDKVFYVYCGKFDGVDTEIYAPKCCAETIWSLWYGCLNSDGDSGFNESDLGCSDVYVLGTVSGYSFNANYYTQLCDKSGGYALSNILGETVTEVSLQKLSGVEGKICGGAVTYAASGAAVLSDDGTTTFAADSSLSGKNQFQLTSAGTDGFQETYLSCLPILKCDSAKLDLATKSSYSEKVGSKETLQEYLNSFGFFPGTVSVSSETGLELISAKGADDAVLVPTDYKFEKEAGSAALAIVTNLHNTDQEFSNALEFCGKNVSGNLDTLTFSGDNSNLKPEAGVTYTDVNVTFSGTKSWIEHEGQDITFQGSSATPTLNINANTSIYGNLNITKANLAVGATNVVKVFGTFTYAG